MPSHVGGWKMEAESRDHGYTEKVKRYPTIVGGPTSKTNHLFIWWLKGTSNFEHQTLNKKEVVIILNSFVGVMSYGEEQAKNSIYSFEMFHDTLCRYIYLKPCMNEDVINSYINIIFEASALLQYSTIKKALNFVTATWTYLI